MAELTAPFEAGRAECRRQMLLLTVNATAVVGLTVAVSYWLSCCDTAISALAPQKVYRLPPSGAGALPAAAASPSFAAFVRQGTKDRGSAA